VAKNIYKKNLAIFSSKLHSKNQFSLNELLIIARVFFPKICAVEKLVKM
jgi:hypothetical protein